MGKEIERKFLVQSMDYRENSKGVFYRQGYLSSHKDRVVRIRIIEDRGYITIKGQSKGIIRPEYEYEIPFSDAKEMLDNLCEKPLIEKYRYKCMLEGFFWEIDEFLGENDGLVIAEIELSEEDTDFIKPQWIGREVTGEVKYYNNSLIKNPYKSWK